MDVITPKRMLSCNKFRTCDECTQSGYCLWTDYDLLRCRFRSQMDRQVSYYVNTPESCAQLLRLKEVVAEDGDDNYNWLYYFGAFVAVFFALVFVFVAIYCKYARKSSSHVP